VEWAVDIDMQPLSGESDDTRSLKSAKKVDKELGRSVWNSRVLGKLKVEPPHTAGGKEYLGLHEENTKPTAEGKRGGPTTNQLQST